MTTKKETSIDVLKITHEKRTCGTAGRGEAGVAGLGLARPGTAGRGEAW